MATRKYAGRSIASKSSAITRRGTIFDLNDNFPRCICLFNAECNVRNSLYSFRDYDTERFVAIFNKEHYKKAVKILKFK